MAGHMPVAVHIPSPGHIRDRSLFETPFLYSRDRSRIVGHTRIHILHRRDYNIRNHRQSWGLHLWGLFHQIQA
jgi:hypothetical protein